jgi:hypothetical protein
MGKIKRAAELTANTVLGKVGAFLEAQYPNAYPASFFKNHERCRELDRYLDQQEAQRAAPTAPAVTKTEVSPKQLPLWDAHNG